MRKKTQNIARVIEILADGNFHSGEVLGEELGVSRTAVSQYMKELAKFGLDVFRVTGKGYRLAKPLQLLDLDAINRALAKGSGAAAPVVHLERVVSSTNDLLKDRLTGVIESGATVLAEAQTQGRGRRGKAWLSPFGSNLYMSMYWRLEQGMAAAMGLSIALGAALAQLFEQEGIYGVELKWPNDVLVGGRKIAGILIELEGQAVGPAHAIVGIGINLQTPDWFLNEVEQPWTDVQRLLNKPINRNMWAAKLVACCHKTIKEYEQTGLSPFLKRWHKYDRLAMQPVKIIMGDKEIVGIAEGIDENGALLLKREGKLERYHAGEVSLRYGI
ncbi:MULTISPECIES: bifunctional biotin--[acetyl-CoA-carboxylase] ligase/biotin operon repressor BirA [Idiomarinaceae]|uniref:Bifunctional ligase/repressor BirA n=2 Tax=Pseudidiomarina TaxID=2800384 RepID=A0A368UND6_9GAMM|nr:MULTISPECIES: bifunctional biotin--[acetyl-CoA-carboxylase] ligase/biotin operon repressor BirA [Idiomarinaceae]MRJ43027.1 bifunctional biotin--[acetyl-CoA-carboxylase] ligase/biotin operon repressor BirA [Idiomarina sp. FeN1]NCU58209.1 bifunctional biotin--[acetyl-CoA-carboxylase] ligase/biotin operon repressor BirA [Idiomarina sp. FenA--70]NCU60907.1 bifunctional biotin--[acetyl-CoA-carboxylase] ligase/biotin operon repressor BirA [Idiomarina sp. FenBw--71]PWW10630.1 BirA family biotin ope